MAEGALTRLITRCLKVSAGTRAAAGQPGFGAGLQRGPGYYHYRLVLWGISQAGTVIGLVVGLAFRHRRDRVRGVPPRAASWRRSSRSSVWASFSSSSRCRS